MAEKMKKLDCWKCDLMLGMIEPDLKSVTIKAREFYFYVWGGMIKVICWACGSTNLIVDDKFETENEETVKAEETKGHQRAVVKPWVDWGHWTPKARKRPSYRHGPAVGLQNNGLDRQRETTNVQSTKL